MVTRTEHLTEEEARALAIEDGDPDDDGDDNDDEARREREEAQARQLQMKLGLDDAENVHDGGADDDAGDGVVTLATRTGSVNDGGSGSGSGACACGSARCGDDSYAPRASLPPPVPSTATWAEYVDVVRYADYTALGIGRAR